MRFQSSVRLLACIVAGGSAAVASAQLYFTDVFLPDHEHGYIRRVETDGSGLTEIKSTGGGIRGLDIDRQGGKMYWADVNDLRIRRANLDGTGQEDLIELPGGEEPAFPSALAVHGGKLYWGDQTLGTMNRSNLDGSGQEVLFSTPFHRGLEIDAVNGKLYWSTTNTELKGEVWRSNLDGTGREVVLTSQDARFKPNKLALDIAGGKIYWTDYVVDIVRRANLDGTQMETIYTPPFNRNPQGITLDLQAGMVYWGQDIEIEGHTGKIMAARLDGSNPYDFLTGFGHVTEMHYVVPEPMTMLGLAGACSWLLLRRRRDCR
ncbi:MAG: hypothetical protein HONBIEJF_00956 [Fimbriimonadaceae bacterium]|nr:hypothetical protein [Fimbriimonadaceae bacterium]